jgi:hypothetical protein
MSMSWYEFGMQAVNTNDLLVDSLVGLTDALGAAVAGQEGAMKSMVMSTLGGLKQIINGLLAQAIAGMIAGESRRGLLGLVTASIGIGALTAMFNKVPAFATGGIAYGDTLARVGEYSGARANPEVIAPLNKLKSLLPQQQAAGQVEVIGSTQIKDDHILISYNRAAARSLWAAAWGASLISALRAERERRKKAEQDRDAATKQWKDADAAHALWRDRAMAEAAKIVDAHAAMEAAGLPE